MYLLLALLLVAGFLKILVLDLRQLVTSGLDIGPRASFCSWWWCHDPRINFPTWWGRRTHRSGCSWYPSLVRSQVRFRGLFGLSSVWSGHGIFGDDDLVAVAVRFAGDFSNGMGNMAREGTLASPSVTAHDLSGNTAGHHGCFPDLGYDNFSMKVTRMGRNHDHLVVIIIVAKGSMVEFEKFKTKPYIKSLTRR